MDEKEEVKEEEEVEVDEEDELDVYFLSIQLNHVSFKCSTYIVYNMLFYKEILPL